MTPTTYTNVGPFRLRAEKDADILAALEELAQSGLTLTVGGALKDGKIKSLWADRVPLVVDGEQKVHLIPSQSWEER